MVGNSFRLILLLGTRSESIVRRVGATGSTWHSDTRQSPSLGENDGPCSSTPCTPFAESRMQSDLLRVERTAKIMTERVIGHRWSYTKAAVLLLLPPSA